MGSAYDGKTVVVLPLIALVVSCLALFPGTGRASAVADAICANTGSLSVSLADTDNDGFTDYEECQGLNTIPRALEPPYSYTYAQFNYVGYLDSSNRNRSEYLDPETRDVFVIMTTVPGGRMINLPNPLEYLGGLYVTPHVITSADGNRAITYRSTSTVGYFMNQAAINVTEDLSPATDKDTALGAGIQGTPSTASYARVYTDRIINCVASICNGSSSCMDSSGISGPDAIADRYIKHTIAHEAGHNVSLAPVYVERYGGNHYSAGSGTVMEQSVKYTNKGGKVTFYISTQFTGTDPASMKLK